MIGYRDLTRVFARIGLLSFGGPAAQIALMHRELVETRGWLTEAQFLRALSLCMLLPGPEAMQLCAYAGWRLRGIPGGLIAGALFILPGALVIAVLAAAYLAWGDLPLVIGLFFGGKACVLAIVVEALIRVARRALHRPLHWLIALGAFAGIAGIGLPFPLVIAAAALVGALDRHPLPSDAALLPVSAPGRALWLLLPGAVIWLAPLLLVAVLGQGFLTALGLFFAKLAAISFGGAYALLAWMTQTVVQQMGWLTTAQMIDALGLAETTPGPLILVTQFVAILAGAGQGGPAMAVLAGLLCLWLVFVPSFLFIFAFAPAIDWIAARPRLSAALQGVTAGVVGVIATLALWFGSHVVLSGAGPFSLEWPALWIALASAVALIWLRWGLPLVLSAAALAGLLLAL